MRPEALKQARQGQYFQSYRFIKSVELWHKVVANLDNPTHLRSMACNQYGFKYIFRGLVESRRFLPASRSKLWAVKPAKRLFRDQFSRPGFNLPALRGGQLLDLVIDVDGHGYFLSSRARWASMR